MWIGMYILSYAHLVAVIDIMFNEEQPYAVKESGGSFSIEFTLNATASHAVNIMITITDITATGNCAVFNLHSTLKSNF